MNRRRSPRDSFKIKGRLTDEQLKPTARRVASIIENALPDHLERTDPQAWADAAIALGCRVRRYKKQAGVGAGYYDASIPMLIYQYEESDLLGSCRRLIHELAHHVLAQWPRSVLAAGLERYDDSRQSVQHRAARMVEELLLP